MAALREGPVYDVTVEPSTLVVDGLEVAAVHARPDGLPRAGLVLHPDVGGLRPLFDDMARRLATHGLAVCVINDDVTRVSVMGFCMGGHYVLKAASVDRFDAAVSFYGMVRTPEAWRGPGNRIDPLATAAEMAPTLAFFGSNDPWTPADDIEALRTAWSGRTDCEIVVVEGAEHGFVHDPDRDVHRADDAARAWERTLQWIGASAT